MLREYFSHITDELLRKSQRLRVDFATHKPSAGHNREALVGDFLREYLPKAFGVGTGLILSKSGQFSNQADLVIVDHLSNAPLYSASPESIWLVEAVFALIEVKTSLSPSTLADAINKCRRFKNLSRDFADTFGRQKIFESLFVLWAFEAPTPTTVKENLCTALNEVPLNERPDFVIVPGSLLVQSGHYHELTVLGQPNSGHRREIIQRTGENIETALSEGLAVLDLRENALLAWLTWLNSWLLAAGLRRASLHSYVPEDYQLGKVV